MAQPREIRELSRRIRNIERELKRRKTPQLAFSSIDNGSSIFASDEDDNLTMIVGKQFDGTHTATSVTGPTPPTPTLPYVTLGIGALRIYWDGTFEGDAYAPMDFARVIAYAEPLVDYSSAEPLNQAIMVGQFTSATGGELTASLDPGVEYAIYLVCWSQSGKYSTASSVATATPGSAVTDGSPPAAPTLSAIGGLNAVYLRWVPASNPDPQRFKVYASDQVAFTADEDTFVTEVDGFSTTVKALPGIDETSGLPPTFEYGRNYYFKVIPHDDDGAGPASNEASAQVFQVTGPDIAVDTIRGENIIGGTLTGDLFSGSVVLGSKISTGAQDENGNIVGQRVDLSPTGLELLDGDDNQIVYLPTDPEATAFIRARLDILRAEVRDNFVMHGTKNAVAADSQITLDAGVEPPAASPTPTAFWDSINLDTTTEVAYANASPGYDLGTFKLNPANVRAMSWNETWNVWSLTQVRSGGFRIWNFNSDGSIAEIPFGSDPWVSDFENVTDPSICYDPVGNGNAFMYSFSGGWTIWGYDPDGVPRINIIPSAWIVDNFGAPSLGFDPSTNRYTLFQQDYTGTGNRASIRKFRLNAATGGATFGTATSAGLIEFTDEARSQRCNGHYHGGGMGLGGTRWVSSVDEQTAVKVMNDSGTHLNTDGSYENWSSPTASVAFGQDGSNFYTLDSAGTLWKHENWNWTALSRKAWVGMSAFDSDTAGDTANPHAGQTAGQHETPVGELLSFNQQRRAKLQFTVPETNDAGGNDDPDKWKIYFVRQDAEPVAADLDLVGTIGSPTTPTSTVISNDPAGGAPPGGIGGTVSADNNFPAGNPSKIRSAASDGSGPIIDLNGDGAGRAGPYEWDSDGVQVDGDPTYDTGWVSGWAVKGGSTPFPNNGNTVIDRAVYRRVGKTVHLSLLVTLGANYTPAATNHTNQAIVDSLPAAVRPAYATVAASHCQDVPVAVEIGIGGVISWVGSAALVTYSSGSKISVDASWMID